MTVNREGPDATNRRSDDGTFGLSDLVAIIGYKLTAYIVGATSTQSVVDWIQSGLPPEFEPRIRAALDVVGLIAEAESKLIAQSFLMRRFEEMGSYRTPAGMLRVANVETARSILLRVADKFHLNEVTNLDDLACRLVDWISHSELPDRVGYRCELWRDRLYLTLVHSKFPKEVQRKWNIGIDWPCWNQITATVPEIAGAPSDIDLTTGFPFKYLRSRILRRSKKD
jgi:hypothetical protein